jgi:hypothetical protein
MGVLIRVRRVALALVVGGASSLLWASPAAGVAQASPRLSGEQARAGFLYNCALFVDWPRASFTGDVLTIGVFGDDAMSDVVEEMDGRTVNGRTIAVVSMRSLGELDRTHILYVTGGPAEVRAVLERVGSAPTLTVSEQDGFTSDGGVVRLFTDQGRLRFEINMTQAERAGLRVSAKMLGLAKIVR